MAISTELRKKLDKSFWRKNAALTMYIAEGNDKNSDSKVVMKFMKSSGDGKYSESKDYFTMTDEELFKFILMIERYAKGKLNKEVTLIHKSKDTKVLTFRKTDNGDFMLSMNKFDQNNNKTAYYISFNTLDLKYFIAALKKYAYFLETGTLQGFNIPWE